MDRTLFLENCQSQFHFPYTSDFVKNSVETLCYTVHMKHQSRINNLMEFHKHGKKKDPLLIWRKQILLIIFWFVQLTLSFAIPNYDFFWFSGRRSLIKNNLFYNTEVVTDFLNPVNRLKHWYKDLQESHPWMMAPLWQMGLVNFRWYMLNLDPSTFGGCYSCESCE